MSLLKELSGWKTYGTKPNNGNDLMTFIPHLFKEGVPL